MVEKPKELTFTTCLGAGLTDTLFALDEPTIGLHQQDIDRLIKILKDLASTGNFVCVVEHDEQVIRAVDKVIELGPRPGVSGGEITFNGTVTQLLSSKKSETGKWLRGKAPILTSFQKHQQETSSHSIEIKEANIHNLKNFNAKIPLGKLTCISGLSGSGKSTFTLRSYL